MVVKKAPVAWDDICRPRAVGGLNLVHLHTWNKACYGLYIKKVDKLCIKWIHAYYMKTAQVLTMEAPHDSSYFLKKVLKCRDYVLQQQGGRQIFDGS